MLICCNICSGHWSHNSHRQKSQKERELTLTYVPSAISYKKSVQINHKWPFVFLLSGYPQEEDGEGSAGAANSDWCSLWAEEEGGRGADWTQRQNCKVPLVFPPNKDSAGLQYGRRLGPLKTKRYYFFKKMFTQNSNFNLIIHLSFVRICLKILTFFLKILTFLRIMYLI